MRCTHTRIVFIARVSSLPYARKKMPVGTRNTCVFRRKSLDVEHDGFSGSADLRCDSQETPKKKQTSRIVRRRHRDRRRRRRNAEWVAVRQSVVSVGHAMSDPSTIFFTTNSTHKLSFLRFSHL